VRSLGDRYASDTFYEPKLSGYTVFDLGASYRWRFLEVALLVENLTNTEWRSSEFYYSSCVASEVGLASGCPAVGGGSGVSDFHFTPGNPRNVRGRVTVYF
jgi:outer membrane receptor protein involved in Fe transport